MTVVVVGSANADLVTQVERRPAAGETVSGSDVATYPGGKGANQAAAAGRAGAATTFCGCVGDDDHGTLLVDALGEAGVDTSPVRRVERPTGIAMIQVTPDGENSIVVCPGANADVTTAYADEVRTSWESADAVVLNLEIPIDTVRQVATGTRGRVVLNAAPATRLDDELLALADPLVVNETEARAVLDLDEELGFDDVARRLLDAGARSVVITLGSDGAIVIDADGSERVPAYRVEVVDSTGAGDAFVGALAAELAGGASLLDAARFATAMSALSVQRAGAQASYPTRAEIEEQLSRAPA